MCCALIFCSELTRLVQNVKSGEIEDDKDDVEEGEDGRFMLGDENSNVSDDNRGEIESEQTFDDLEQDIQQAQDETGEGNDPRQVVRRACR